MVRVAFDQAVTVSGAPSIEFEAGGNQSEHLKQATYASGSGTATLRFSYVVQAADKDDNGIWLKADKLELNGGRIQGVDDNVAADLSYRLARQAAGPQRGRQPGARQAGPDHYGRRDLQRHRPGVLPRHRCGQCVPAIRTPALPGPAQGQLG